MARKIKKKTQSTPLLNVPFFTASDLRSPSPVRNKFIYIVILFLLVIGIVLFRNKQWFVAAMVNGQPIPRSALDEKLKERYAKTTLDALIGEMLISQQAAKKGFSVSNQQIEDELQKTKASLPKGMNFEEALSFQGMTEKDFRNQIRIRLLVDQLLSNQASVSATEVDSFISQNKKSLTATNDADMRKEAENIVRSQKTQELFQTWYQNLQKDAKIQKFL